MELCLGILFVGVLCQFIGMWFAESKLYYTIALWLGLMLAVLSANHMYKTLDRALDMGAAATKEVTKWNLVRYACIIIVFGIAWAIGTLNLLVVFMGLMSLKVAAYLQPFTHKLCNKVLGVTER